MLWRFYDNSDIIHFNSQYGCYTSIKREREKIKIITSKLAISLLDDKRRKRGDGKHGEETTTTLVVAVGYRGASMLSTSDKPCNVFHYADLKTTTRVGSALLANEFSKSAMETTITGSL